MKCSKACMTSLNFRSLWSADRTDRTVMSTGSDLTLEDWKRKNPSAAQYLIFIQKSFYNGDDFAAKRQKVHESAIQRLTHTLEIIQANITDIAARIEELHSHEIPDLRTPATDSKDVIMKLRILAVCEQRLLKHNNQNLTKRYSALCDWEKELKDCLDLFALNLLPSSVMCSVSEDLLVDGDRFLACKSHVRKAKCYLRLSKRYKEELMKETKALWACDFPLFMKSLVQTAKLHFSPELSYLEPFEGEVSLSRCLFGYKSPYTHEIDKVVDQIVTIDGEKFTEKLVEKCYSMMTFRDSMDITEQSLALLLFFRCIFNRCYEKYPSFFAPKTLEDVNRLCRIPSFLAKQFLLPHSMLAVEITDQTVESVFRDDEGFRKASEFMERSVFMCNPVDALFCIHNCLIQIHTAAMHNRKDLDEDNSDPSKQLLCFDALFALFFGCLMGTGPPTTDVFYLSWLIGQFAPKESLSPSFEYAEANLEALAMHCRNIDISALENGDAVSTDC